MAKSSIPIQDDHGNQWPRAIETDELQVSQRDKAELEGTTHGLSAVPGAEFPEDVSKMCFD